MAHQAGDREAEPKKVVSRKSALLPIFLIVFVDILGLTLILPLLPFYAEKFGATPHVVGMLTASFAFCQLIGGPLLGRLSDKMGRKPLLLVSQLGTFIGFLILAFAGSLPLVFLSRIIDGITAGNLSIAQAYISDVTEPKNRAKAFGIIGISFGMGFLIGPAISGYLSQFGYHYPVFAAAGLSALSILATTFLLPSAAEVAEMTAHHASASGAAEEGPVAPGGQRLSLFQWGEYFRYFKRPGLGSLLAQLFMFCFSFSLFVSGFALFAERRFAHGGIPYGPKEVGYVFAFSGLIGALIQGGLLGRLVKKFGERRLIASGFVASAAGYGTLTAAEGAPGILTASGLSSFGHSVLRPSLTSLITQAVGRGEQGVVLGLTQSLNSVAQITAPLVAGFLIEHSYLSAWAWVTALASIAGLLFR